jgi:ATP-binding cassette subfamily B multidrug efflux pump
MIGVSVIATVWYGGHLVINKTIEPGNITEFILYVYKLTWPFASLGWVTSLIQRASASQTRINEFLKTKSTYQLIRPRVKQIIEGDIEFKNVRFYLFDDSKIEALKNSEFENRKR